MDWIEVLTAFAALAGASRHPEDVCRGVPNALAVAKGLADDGYLYRNPATGYFKITPAGTEMAKVLEMND